MPLSDALDKRVPDAAKRRRGLLELADGCARRRLLGRQSHAEARPEQLRKDGRGQEEAPDGQGLALANVLNQEAAEPPPVKVILGAERRQQVGIGPVDSAAVLLPRKHLGGARPARSRSRWCHAAQALPLGRSLRVAVGAVCWLIQTTVVVNVVGPRVAA